MTDTKMLNYKQTAELLGIPVGTVYSLVSQNRIPHLRIGPRFVRFSHDDLQAWLASKQVESRDCLKKSALGRKSP